MADSLKQIKQLQKELADLKKGLSGFKDIKLDNFNENQLKVTFYSPKIDVYNSEIKDVLLRTDNQNSLYNSHLTASEINTDYYSISKLNLLSLNQQL